MAGPVIAPPKRVMDPIRTICLAYPEAREDALCTRRSTSGRGCSLGRRRPWRPARGLPLGHELQDIRLQKTVFYRPSHVGNKGCVGINRDGKTEWKEVAGIVDIGYRRVALKRQFAKLAASSSSLGRRKSGPGRR